MTKKKPTSKKAEKPSKKKSTSKKATIKPKPKKSTKLVAIKDKLERTRETPRRLTNDERIAMLEDILDESIRWLSEQTFSHDAKGTAGAAHIIERARLEIEAMRKGTNVNDGEMIIRYELQLPDPKGK